MKIVNKANNLCPTLAALKPVAQVPRGQVLTFVDLGPRLIAVTHHDAVAGPYHRNGRDIIDVMRTFRGTAEAARATVMRRGIDYVLICPGSRIDHLFQSGQAGLLTCSGARQGARLAPAGARSSQVAYRMWRVVGP